jgi:hypothetical protein
MYREGVRAVQAAVAGWSPERWAHPVRGTWTGTDLAGHLLCAVRWHHSWLDRAEAGDASPPFRVDELAIRSRQALVGLRPRTGDDRLQIFAEEAGRYVERLDSSWALPYGCPHGTLPAGAHAALAALEWHLHAWDLTGGTHRPSDPRLLLAGAARALGAAQRGLVARLWATITPQVPRSRGRWEWTLDWAGRVPCS